MIPIQTSVADEMSELSADGFPFGQRHGRLDHGECDQLVSSQQSGEAAAVVYGQIAKAGR